MSHEIRDFAALEKALDEAQAAGDADAILSLLNSTREVQVKHVNARVREMKGKDSTLVARIALGLVRLTRFEAVTMLRIHKLKRDKLERRIEELERAQKEFRYRGVYQPAETYSRSNLCTYDGSLWIAIDDHPGKPGQHGWQLCAKRGRDARE